MNKVLERVRHETRIRLLDVVAVTDVTPKMRRITLAGPELDGFASPGYSDHVKVFFSPDPDQPVLPVLGPDGPAFPADQKRPEMRDYTPRFHDPANNTLDLDFVLHGDGPASSWAAQARVGQKLVIGGPRGSLIVPTSFDWYLLVGDATALPAISRRLEELPLGKPAIAVIEVEDEAEQQTIATRAEARIHWVHRGTAPAGTTTLLLDAVRGLSLPAGECYAFLAGEAGTSRAIRDHLVAERGLNPEWIKAAGYWLLGVADAHEPH